MIFVSLRRRRLIRITIDVTEHRIRILGMNQCPEYQVEVRNRLFFTCSTSPTPPTPPTPNIPAAASASSILILLSIELATVLGEIPSSFTRFRLRIKSGATCASSIGARPWKLP